MPQPPNIHAELQTLESTDQPREIVVDDARHVLLTRAQAARRLGVSLATVRRMEGEELHPIIVDGKHCFAIEELDRHRKLTDGDLASLAFTMFNEDRSQVDAVIALKAAPERIRSLHQDWVEMSDLIVAGPPGLGGRRLRDSLKPRLTRRLVWVCLAMVLRDPRLRAIAERELGHALV